MFFKYKGIDDKGKKTKGYIEASDLDDAKKKLSSNGIFYSYLKADTPAFTPLKKILQREFPPKKLAILSRNLSIYLKSGVSSIVQAIRLEKQQHEDDKKMMKFLNSVESSLIEGKSFYSSLELQDVYKLPRYYKQSVKVAEESGRLGEILKELGGFIKNREKIKNRVSNALTYPLFIVVISFFMVGFMLSVVVPKITSMFKQLNQELPSITQFVINLGDFIKKDYIYIILSIFLIITIFIYLYKNVGYFTKIIDRLILRLPLFGKIVKTSELSEFSYIVSLLLASGVTFVQAVKLASNTIKNRVLYDVFKEASDEIVKGKKLSNALLKHKEIVDKAFIQSISLGEETSQMRDVLENLSELYNEENSDKIGKMLSLLEPVLILIVGVIIGTIIIAMLLPIFSINIAT